MATSKIKGLDEPTLEGGIGGGGGMGRGSSSKLDNVFGIEGKALSKSKPKKENEIPEVPMDIKGAVEAAEKYQAKYGPKGHRSDPIIEKLQDQLGVDRRAGRIKSEVIDPSKGSRSVLEEAERNKALDQFRRKKALSEATTEGGVTKYPYIEPTSKKAGGAVTASRRADGIAQRGKTRGKMC
jgi:hypothetical protein